MKQEKTFMDEARQNILNICYDLEETLKIVDTFRRKGYKYFSGSNHSQTPNEEMFYDGLSKIYYALQSEYYKNIDKAFVLSGVVNKEMEEYAKQKFVERFEDASIEVMSYLSDNGSPLGGYKSSDREGFRKEIDAELKKLKSKKDKK